MTAAANRPTSTYRVQVRPQFDLDTAADLAPYLADLGVTHLYSAPILTATPGSEHGYDVVDPTRVNPELGGPEALDRLVAALRSRGLGLVVDIVPNHLGVRAPEANPAWWSVLRDGPESPYAAWFDIDWNRGPLMIPVLADESAALFDLKVVGDELRYFEHRYPIAPGTGEGSPIDVHRRQAYRLVHWQRANDVLTYRRFFAISDLAGLRVEDPAVFDATHREILRWVADGLVDGIRVDHPDGLTDPGAYLRKLRGAAPMTWLIVEKILEFREELPADWPVDGTTGYDAMREVNGVFIDTAAAGSFESTVAVRRGRPRRQVGRRHRAARHRTDPPDPARAHRRPVSAKRSPTSRRTCRSTAPIFPRAAKTSPVRWPPPGPVTRRPSTRSCRCSPTRTTNSRNGSSSTPAPSWPRASKTPPTTGGPVSSRSTRSAAHPTASAWLRRSSTWRPADATPTTPTA